MTVIGSKWRAIILWHILKAGSIRYGELKKSIPKISHKVFSHELKNLEMDGLVERIVYDSNPPKVEYLATARGKSLESILTKLCEWGREYMNSN
jgi:DNA-binding HxlR family transcriptional regulator